MNLDLFRDPGDPDPVPPSVGDVILTARLAKVVTDVRPVESRVWHHRWHLGLSKIGSGRRDDPAVVAEVARLVDAGAEVRETWRYERGQGPAAFARVRGLAVDAG